MRLLRRCRRLPLRLIYGGKCIMIEAEAFPRAGTEK
jgi:hypothetical protein